MKIDNRICYLSYYIGIYYHDMMMISMVTVSCWQSDKIYYVLCITPIVTKQLLWHDDRKYWIGIRIRPGNCLDGRPEFWLCNRWIIVFQSDTSYWKPFWNDPASWKCHSTDVNDIHFDWCDLDNGFWETSSYGHSWKTFSGHYCVYTVLNISKPTPLKHRHNYVKFRDFKNFDENALLNNVRNNACFQNHYGSGCSQRLGCLEMQRSIPCYL